MVTIFTMVTFITSVVFCEFIVHIKLNIQIKLVLLLIYPNMLIKLMLQIIWRIEITLAKLSISKDMLIFYRYV